MLLFSSEIETKITAEQGRVFIQQNREYGDINIVELSVRQFMEIISQHEVIVDAAVRELK